MPRVTEAHRRARRDEIAEAAVRVLLRKGVSSTSIAQIVEESGLSAGAIYANFTNKSELAQYVARSLLGWRIDLLDAEAATGEVRSPTEVLRTVLGFMTEHAPPLPLVLQFWGEATTDPDLHAVLEARVSELRAALERSVLPWARQQAPEDPDGEARRLAATMVVLSQGYLANTALLGWTTPDEYLATARAVFSG